MCPWPVCIWHPKLRKPPDVFGTWSMCSIASDTWGRKSKLRIQNNLNSLWYILIFRLHSSIIPCLLNHGIFHRDLILINKYFWYREWCFFIFTQLKLSFLKMITSSCRKPVPLILDQEYVNLKNQIIKAERRVLKELGFCVHVKHPHKVCTL